MSASGSPVQFCLTMRCKPKPPTKTASHLSDKSDGQSRTSSPYWRSSPCRNEVLQWILSRRIKASKLFATANRLGAQYVVGTIFRDMLSADAISLIMLSPMNAMRFAPCEVGVGRVHPFDLGPFSPEPFTVALRTREEGSLGHAGL